MTIKRKIRLQGLAQELGTGGEIGKVLEKLRLPAGVALRMMQGERMRRHIQDMEALRGIQRELIMQQSGLQAAKIMAGQLENEEKPELRLRAAIAVLQMAGRGRERGGDKETGGQGMRLSEEEIRAGLAERLGK